MSEYAHMVSLTILLVFVGLVAGVLAGLFGIGGGLIIVPALTFIFLELGMSPDQVLPTAIATSLGSMLLTSAGAVWGHHKKIGSDGQTILRLAPGMMLGGLAGAWLATALPTLLIGLIFAGLVSMIGLKLALDVSPPSAEASQKLRFLYLAGPLMGLASTLIGIGGGSFVVPYLVWNGYVPVAAVAVASATGWLLALSGTLGFVITGPAYLDIRWIMTVGLAGLVAAPWGVALAHRLSATRLRRLFGLMLVLVAFRMLWQIYSAA